jgi:hypothetical protein
MPDDEMLFAFVIRHFVVMGDALVGVVSIAVQKNFLKAGSCAIPFRLLADGGRGFAKMHSGKTPTRHFTGGRTLPRGRSLGGYFNLPKTHSDNFNNGEFTYIYSRRLQIKSALIGR